MDASHKIDAINCTFMKLKLSPSSYLLYKISIQSLSIYYTNSLQLRLKLHWIVNTTNGWNISNTISAENVLRRNCVDDHSHTLMSQKGINVMVLQSTKYKVRVCLVA